MVEKLNLSSTRCWNMKKMQLIVNSIWVIKQGEQYKTGARKRQNRRHIYCKNDFQIMHLFCKMSYISYPSWQPIHFKWHTTPFSNTFLHHLIGIAKIFDCAFDFCSTNEPNIWPFKLVLIWEWRFGVLRSNLGTSSKDSRPSLSCWCQLKICVLDTKDVHFPYFIISYVCANVFSRYFQNLFVIRVPVLRYDVILKKFTFELLQL